MSDLSTEAVRLAVMAAGTADDPHRWAARVASLTPQIASMLRPPLPGHEDDATTPIVTARKVLEALAFRAEFVDFELEAKSQRLIVRFRSRTVNRDEQDGDGLESLRTEPMWTPAGRAMRRVLKSLESGQEVVVFKHVDVVDKERKSRVLVHLEVRHSNQKAPVHRHEETTPAGGDPPAPVEHHSPADNARISELETRSAALTPRQRVAFFRLCRESGIRAPMLPEDDQFDQVLAHLSTIEKGPQRG